MLKKVSLVVVALLVTASLANAAAVSIALSDISITYSGNVFTITGNVASELAFGVYNDAHPTQGVFSNITKFPAGGGLSFGNVQTDGSTYNGIDFGTQSDTLSTPNVLITTGKWFTFNYSGADKVFNIYDESPAGLAQVPVTGPMIGTITATPEPATMAILGLGALLIRRKK